MSLKTEIEKIAKEEGFKNISDFVESFIKKGHSLTDFHYHIAYEHGLFYSYDALYSAIRSNLNFDLRETRGKVLREKKELEKMALKSLKDQGLHFGKEQLKNLLDDL
jgi:hypothetical protein